MLKFFKKEIPTGEVEEVEAVETWIVYWTSRHGEFSGDTRKRAQAFTDEDVAQKFKKSLEDAHDLIGNTGSGSRVTIEKQK